RNANHRDTSADTNERSKIRVRFRGEPTAKITGVVIGQQDCVGRARGVVVSKTIAGGEEAMVEAVRSNVSSVDLVRIIYASQIGKSTRIIWINDRWSEMAVAEPDKTASYAAKGVNDTRDIAVIINFLRKSADSSGRKIECFQDLDALLSK